MTALPLWAMLPLVAVAGGIGALVRHATSVTGKQEPSHIRRRITVVNTVGAFFAGALLVIDHPVAIALAVGLFGSLTTFSTIAVWWAEDIRQRESIRAIRSVLVHVAAGVPAVLVGFVIGQMLS